MKFPSRPDGLKFDPDAGVLLAPRSRFEPDPDQPRQHFPAQEIKELRADIEAWRAAGRGLSQTGIMTPLQCRWEPGAVDARGNVKKTAKLIIVDGERRWRATEGGWDWLPLVLDDMPSEDAHDAALRTSIHKKQLLPIEEANAFQRKKELAGWGTYRLARHYNISEGYVKNRIYLLECTQDVQRMVEKHPDTLSHALAFRAAGDKLLADDRKELITEVNKGMSLVALKDEIQERIAAHEFKSQSRQAPDAHTQSRQKQAAITGSAPVSRGKQVTATTPRHAKAEVEALVIEITGKIFALESFAGSVDQKYFREKVLPNVRRWQETLDLIIKKAK
jgi:ParB/RepB/Spo0J family partition protein